MHRIKLIFMQPLSKLSRLIPILPSSLSLVNLVFFCSPLFFSDAPIEPDFLPNIVLNRDLSSCQQSRQNYRDGVAYALKALGTLSNLMQ